MPNLQLAAWVAIIGAAAVIAAFVAAEAFLYFLRSRHLARIIREPLVEKGPAPRVGTNVPRVTRTSSFAHAPGAVARHQTAPPGKMIDGRK